MNKKQIMPTIQINALYNMLLDENECTFEPDEVQKADKEFTSKFIDAMMKTDIKKGIEMESLYTNALNLRELHSFEIGFKTAMQILLSFIKQYE